MDLQQNPTRLLRRPAPDRANDFAPLDGYPPAAAHVIWLNRARLMRWSAILDGRELARHGDAVNVLTKRLRERVGSEKMIIRYCIRQASRCRMAKQ